jgi:hypothetical protein
MDKKIDNLMDKLFEYLFKLLAKLLKLFWKVFKKGFSNIQTIKKTLTSKEKYLLIISLIIPVIFIWMYKLHPRLFFLCVNYPWTKAVLQVVKKEIQNYKINKLT